MLKFLKNCKELFILLTQVSIKRNSNVFLIDLPNIILTINPKILLISSSLEQAQQISELELLYGDNWSNIYKELITKQRLESTLKHNTNINTNTKPTNNKCCCNKEITNVCS